MPECKRCMVEKHILKKRIKELEQEIKDLKEYDVSSSFDQDYWDKSQQPLWGNFNEE